MYDKVGGHTKLYNLSQEVKARQFMFWCQMSLSIQAKGALNIIVLFISTITGLLEVSSEGNKYTGNIELQCNTPSHLIGL